MAGDGVGDGADDDVAPRQPVAPQHEAGGQDGEQRDGDERAQRDLLEPGPEPGLREVLQRTAAVLLDRDGGDGCVGVAGVAGERTPVEGGGGHAGPLKPGTVATQP